MTRQQCDIAVIGLGVMGRNLVCNLCDHGYQVLGFDLDADQREAARRYVESEITDGQLHLVDALPEVLKQLSVPRVMILLVPAGQAVEDICDALVGLGADETDLVIDCGNSLWTDTIAREQRYQGRLRFFGSGLSGGEEGARFGASLMPSGHPESWQHLRPFWEKIAAKVDPVTGIEQVRRSRTDPLPDGVPCTAYMGTDGAGHYVKMVHNGIEYADMQLIAEAWHLMQAWGFTADDAAAVFDAWNQGELQSYLIEISAAVLRQKDGLTGRPLVEMILDKAGQKGTGRWTALNALDLGTPSQTIASAVFARAMSALKTERLVAAKVLSGPEAPARLDPATRQAWIADLGDALYCAKLSAYAQGFELLKAASSAYGWQLDFTAIAGIWRGGCIIRAGFLGEIAETYRRNPGLANLLLAPSFVDAVRLRQAAWRRVVSGAVQAGIPVPALSTALTYYDGYRTAVLPANLIQGQRDYFGAHTYERLDRPAGEAFHTLWHADGLEQRIK